MARVSGEEIKTEAWILRNLVTIISQAAKRPHVPRSKEFRLLFRAIGIDVPETEAGISAALDGHLAYQHHFKYL